MLPPGPSIVPVPAHVPRDLVYDFDFHQVPGAEDDVHLAWFALQKTHPEIFWTPRNGGHWVVTRADEIEMIEGDHTRFSMVNTLIPNIPRPFPSPPIDLDPPEHGPYRRLIAPAFSPKMIASLETKVRGLMVSITEDLAPKGQCEFISQVAKVLPIIVFLGMMDLPAEDRDILLPLADRVTRSPDPAENMKARLEMADYLKVWIERRRENPGEDLISRIVTAQIDGKPLPEKTVIGMGVLFLNGGLDTVASMLGFIARFLAMHPDHRRQLRENPAIIPHAAEELFRRHGISNTGRVIVRDFEHKGLTFRKGDVIQQPNGLFGLDERRVNDPLTVDFSRPAPIPQATFGGGPHKCPGAILARNETKIFIEEWLKRIPDFEITPGTKPKMKSGLVNAIKELHLTWTPVAA